MYYVHKILQQVTRIQLLLLNESGIGLIIFGCLTYGKVVFHFIWKDGIIDKNWLKGLSYKNMKLFLLKTSYKESERL